MVRRIDVFDVALALGVCLLFVAAYLFFELAGVVLAAGVMLVLIAAIGEWAKTQ